MLRLRRVIVAALAIASVVAIPTPAHAATMTWADTSTPLYWSRATNWQEGRAPRAGDDLHFPFGQGCGANDISPRLDIGSITFGPNCQVDGEPVGILRGLTAAAPKGYTVGFLMPVTVLGDQTWGNGPADVVADDGIDLQGHTLTFDGSGRFIPGPFTGRGAVVKRGSGDLFLRPGVTSDSSLDVYAGAVLAESRWEAPLTLHGGRLSGPGPLSDFRADGGVISLARSYGAFGPESLTAGRVVLAPGATLEAPYRESRLIVDDIDLGGARLDVTMPSNNSEGEVIRIVDKRTPGPVTGTFADLPEGSVFAPYGERWRISYAGGDGNDVELTSLGWSSCSADAPSWPPSSLPVGYRLVAADGGIFTFGRHGFEGASPSTFRRAVGLATPPNKVGYWTSRDDGSVSHFGPGGTAGQDGHSAMTQPGSVVAITAASTCSGYWQVTGTGQVYGYWGAGDFGSVQGPLTRPVVGMAATPTGDGYWLVASDGGIFTFGDAPFLGSTGAIRLNQAHRRHGRHPHRTAATGSSPPTAASSPSATPPSSAPPAPSASTSPSSAWPPPPPATATGSSPPTAASSPSATPPSSAPPAPSASTSRSSGWPRSSQGSVSSTTRAR